MLTSPVSSPSPSPAEQGDGQGSEVLRGYARHAGVCTMSALTQDQWITMITCKSMQTPGLWEWDDGMGIPTEIQQVARFGQPMLQSSKGNGSRGRKAGDLPAFHPLRRFLRIGS